MSGSVFILSSVVSECTLFFKHIPALSFDYSGFQFLTMAAGNNRSKFSAHSARKFAIQNFLCKAHPETLLCIIINSKFNDFVTLYGALGCFVNIFLHYVTKSSIFFGGGAICLAQYFNLRGK